MSNRYDRYLQGAYQEVYDELLAMQEQVFDEPIYAEALAVAREMMRRVRHNVELLIPRLEEMDYDFGAGFFDEEDSPELVEQIMEDAPIFRPPDENTPEQVARLERLVGSLPLALKCWYEEVGSVNLIGLFSDVGGQEVQYRDGPVWDPLCVYSIELALKMVTSHLDARVWHPGSTLSLSPDRYFKYGYGGSGAYSIQLPCRAFDAPLLLEEHQTTFVNYLRICLRWGGFPGLATENRLSPMEIDFLTKDLLLF
jgi:hypothetical protein